MSSILLDHDGRYIKAIMFDDKSYVLLNYDGDKKVKGNTLTGRSNEAYLIRFINSCIDHILDEEFDKVKDEYMKWRKMIQGKLLTVEMVKKRQSLNMSLEEYKNKKLSDNYYPIAQYEAALQAEQKYQKGDVIETWVEEPEPVLKEYKTKPDVWKIPKNASSYEQIRLAKDYNGNIYRHHYLDRLEKSARKFLVALGWAKFQILFPNLSILKNDKAKMIPIWGLDKFVEEFPDFGWREKDFKKLSEEDRNRFYAMKDDLQINFDIG